MSFEPSGDAVVILDVDGAVLTTLNVVGSLVWNELDGVRDAAALAGDLVDRFDGVSIADLENDIGAFIETLRDASLVDEA
ncbi:MAG: PqqD family protein [Actinomycetota bacterium]